MVLRACSSIWKKQTQKTQFKKTFTQSVRLPLAGTFYIGYTSKQANLLRNTKQAETHDKLPWTGLVAYDLGLANWTQLYLASGSGGAALYCRSALMLSLVCEMEDQSQCNCRFSWNLRHTLLSVSRKSAACSSTPLLAEVRKPSWSWMSGGRGCSLTRLPSPSVSYGAAEASKALLRLH